LAQAARGGGTARWTAAPPAAAMAGEYGSDDLVAGADPVAGTDLAAGAADHVASFVGRWGLDNRSMNALLVLSPEVQDKAMAGFAPDENTRNVDAKFMAWLRTLTNGGSTRTGGVGGCGTYVEEDEQLGDLLQDFVLRWSFDGQTCTFLQSLPADVQRAVISGFDPPEGTRSVDAKLHAFARARAAELGHLEHASPRGGGGGGAGPSSSFPAGLHNLPTPRSGGHGSSAAGLSAGDLIPDFLAKWGLDEGSGQTLRCLPEGLLHEVIASFAPPTGTRNHNAKLACFVKAKQAELGPAGVHNVAQPLAAPQLLVQQTRAPLPRTAHAPTDYDTASEDIVRQFADVWSLDEASVQMLLELPIEVCTSVIANFNPPPDTQNVNGKLHAFARGALQKGGHPVSGLGGAPAAASAAALPSLASGLGSRGLSALARQAAPADAVGSFAALWGLDLASEALLRTLGPDHLAQVLAEFNPPAGTLNPNGKLNAFVRSVLSGGGVSTAYAPDPVASFASRWGIDGEAEQTLRSLPESARAAVIAEFNPPPGTLNVSGKLKGFIRAKVGTNHAGGSAGGGGGGGGAGLPPLVPLPAVNRPRPTSARSVDGSGGHGLIAEFVSNWQLDAEAEAMLRGLPEDVLDAVVRDFRPPMGTRNPSGKLHAFVRARLADSPAGAAGGGGGSGPSASGALSRPPPLDGGGEDFCGDDVVRDFVLRWNLDPSSESLMRSLPEDVLQRVVQGFAPEANTRNPNAKLAMWVRSITRPGGLGESEPKRQRVY